MEKKSALIGGGIGLAIGMVAMFGIVMGIGSCASSQNVKKFDNVPVLVQRPKKAAMEDQTSPKLVYYLSSLNNGLNSSVANPYLPSLEEGAETELLHVTISERTYPGSGTWTYYADSIDVQSDGSGGIKFPLGSSFISVSSSGAVTANTQGGYLDTIYILADSVVDNPYWDTFKGCFANPQYGELALDRVFTPVAEPVPYEGNLVTEIFEQVGESISNFATALGDSVGQAVALFYDGNGFTPLGILTLVSGGVALVYWTFFLIKKMLNIGVK